MKKAKEKKAKVEKPTTTPFGEGEVVSIEPLHQGSDKVALAKRLEQAKGVPIQMPIPKGSSSKGQLRGAKPSAYTRFDSVAEVIKSKKAKSIPDLVKLADETYASKGGNANAKESRTVVNFSRRLLSHFPEITLPKE